MSGRCLRRVRRSQVHAIVAADASKILLRGTSVNVEDSKVSGAARAVVGELTITAEVITYDKEKNLLRCEGPVAIRSASGVVTAKDCTIELAPGEKKLFFLSRGEIRVGSPMEPLPTSLVPASK